MLFRHRYRLNPQVFFKKSTCVFFQRRIRFNDESVSKMKKKQTFRTDKAVGPEKAVEKTRINTRELVCAG